MGVRPLEIFVYFLSVRIDFRRQTLILRIEVIDIKW